ncbi:MAG TPA: HAD family hydrolase [Caulobacteraceae bacterium]|nr:HAD family hydrolase [Caulobacteraceae bacterium]
MALPRAILFDLDETILSFGRRELLLEEVAERHAAMFAPFTPREAADRLEEAFRDFWSDGERHRIWRQRPLVEARRFIAEQAFADLAGRGAAALTVERAHAFADAFHEHREAQMRCFPGAIETLDAIAEAGVLMALVTNGTSEVQRDKIRRFDLARRFQHIQIEGEHGFGKPEERAYRHALGALGVGAAETWMVGDNLEWEVAAPQRLGIFSIWHDHRGEGLPKDAHVTPDHIITRLDQLLD